ncbi:MAG: DNA polymerase III subunit delta' [Deltaproteobacteria bacterium]
MYFSQIIGQEGAKGFLKQVISRDRIPHAYLFTGIPGIGKTTTARALTVALNCEDPVGVDGCGRCPICHQIEGGNFPDFSIMRPDGQNIKIEQVRELNHVLSFPPVTGTYRISVVHQAETMTGEAANAFLKTLEEPPPQNVLVLTTTEPFDLLPTLVSRCQRVAFQPLDVEEMRQWLVREKQVDPKEAAILAKASEGSLGVALKILASDFLKKRRKWLLDLKTVLESSKAEAVQIAVGSTEKNSRWGLRFSDTGETGLTDMLDIWESWYRDLLVVRTGGSKRLIVNTDIQNQVETAATMFEPDGLIQALFALDGALNDLRRLRNPALVMERTVLNLKRFKEGG